MLSKLDEALESEADGGGSEHGEGEQRHGEKKKKQGPNPSAAQIKHSQPHSWSMLHAEDVVVCLVLQLYLWQCLCYYMICACSSKTLVLSLLIPATHGAVLTQRTLRPGYWDKHTPCVRSLAVLQVCLHISWHVVNYADKSPNYWSNTVVVPL